MITFLAVIGALYLIGVALFVIIAGPQAYKEFKRSYDSGVEFAAHRVMAEAAAKAKAKEANIQVIK